MAKRPRVVLEMPRMEKGICRLSFVRSNELCSTQAIFAKAFNLCREKLRLVTLT